MFYEMTIAGLKRQLPLCKVTDDLYIAAFIMFSDVEITKAAAGELLKKAPQFDIMITAESKGIPLAYEMARQSGASDYIVARKGPKLYMQDIITTEVDSITTDHVQTLCIGKKEADQMRGKRVLIVDDVISTGESADRHRNSGETGRRRNSGPHDSSGRRRGGGQRRHNLLGKITCI